MSKGEGVRITPTSYHFLNHIPRVGRANALPNAKAGYGIGLNNIANENESVLPHQGSYENFPNQGEKSTAFSEFVEICNVPKRLKNSSSHGISTLRFKPFSLDGCDL